MESLDLTKHKNIVFNLAVVVVVFIVAYNIYTRQSRGVEDLKVVRATEQKKNTVLNSINGLEKNISVYSKFLVRRDASFIIDKMSAFAKEEHVNIGSIKPEAEQKFSDYVKLPFSLTVTCADYHVLASFISRIENDPEVYVVEDVVVVPDTQSGQGLSVNLRVSSISYIK